MQWCTQSSNMNVRQYNGVNREVNWMSENTMGSDIHFTPLFTSSYSLTFIFLLCLPHCIVWHSFHSSFYPIVLSDIHFTALFTPLYCLTFILLLCVHHCIVWYSSYCSVYPIVLSVRHYNGVNRAVKWMSDITMG
jgi:hypothetical protein